ncbi:DUF4145 domain-containing protein [Mesorhizobium sp. M0027]|uniref:DUF4145 domain-containing protein n=1 Tax=unclassified Mesorhizobium TaxID=325217 RepID=UPI0006849EF9|nr:DUF4145 domain-containing protein [Mesorhizobium sp. LSHC420B00]
MNYLDFFASLFASATSLAWPAAIVAAVWIFRGELRPLLPRLHLKHKDTEISFRLSEAEKTAEHLPHKNIEIPPPTPEEISRFDKIVQISPRAAILEVRAELESAVYGLAESSGQARKLPFGNMIRLLRDNELIDAGTSALLDDLRVLGNRAAHETSHDFSVDDARRYKAIADRVMNSLQAAKWFEPQAS